MYCIITEPSYVLYYNRAQLCTVLLQSPIMNCIITEPNYELYYNIAQL